MTQAGRGLCIVKRTCIKFQVLGQGIAAYGEMLCMMTQSGREGGMMSVCLLLNLRTCKRKNNKINFRVKCNPLLPMLKYLCMTHMYVCMYV